MEIYGIHKLAFKGVLPTLFAVSHTASSRIRGEVRLASRLLFLPHSFLGQRDLVVGRWETRWPAGSRRVTRDPEGFWKIFQNLDLFKVFSLGSTMATKSPLSPDFGKMFCFSQST